MAQTRIRKFNGGAGAILCNKCWVILKEGWVYTDPQYFYLNETRISKKDWESEEPLYCEKCKQKDNGKD